MSWLRRKQKSLQQRWRHHLRKRAIENAKLQIALAGKHPQDYSEDQREFIVSAEEKKLVEKYKSGALLSILVLIGLS